MKEGKKVILATTFEPEDQRLEAMYTADAIVDHVYRGSRDDLIIRYFGAAQEYGVDTIVRVSGDSPLFSHEIGEILLKSHIETGADYTEAVKCAVGTGCQVWKRSAFQKLLEMGVDWKYSEHMSFFITENPDLFKVNLVELPQDLIRDYRLTLDYQEDFDMLESLFWEILNGYGLYYSGSIYDIREIFACLDDHTEIARMNAHCKQAFDDPDLQTELKAENEKIRNIYDR